MIKTEDVIMKIVAVLAPVPTAWLVGESTMTLEHFPLPVAVAAAATVEGLGFVAVNTVTEMIEFNRHINMIEANQKMHAPVRQAVGVVALYVATAIIMTVILHIAPVLIPYAPLPFIAMMVSVGWMYALRKDQAARVERWGKGRERIAKERAQGKGKKPKVAKSSTQVKRKRITDTELLAYLAEHKGETKEATAAHFGVTHQAIGQRVKKLYDVKRVQEEISQGKL
jgi:hypothetical protein